MSAKLPEPLAAYYAAKNVHDIDAMLATFAEDASVKDEGREHRGREAIRLWMEETTKKYRVTVDVLEVSAADGKTLVTALVSGNFAGSPARLHYVFALAQEKISRLEIG